MKLPPTRQFLFAISAVILLISCHKQVTPPTTQPIRVNRVLDRDDTTYYIYDSRWRLIEYYHRSNGAGSTKKYYYTDSTVTINNFDDKIKFLGVTVYRLNALGLAISMTDTATSTHHTYTYNSEKQVTRLQIQHSQDGINYSSDDYYYFNHNGDLDSSSVLSNITGIRSVTYYPQYDLTKINTLDNEYTGQSFLGATSRHPVQQINGQDGTTLFTFAYTYDPKGRIATQEVKIGDAVFFSPAFTYY